MKTISHPTALIDAAVQAGIDVPSHPTDYNKNEYPHWHFFRLIQVGRPLINDDSHFNNARVIAQHKPKDLNFLNLEHELE